MFGSLCERQASMEHPHMDNYQTLWVHRQDGDPKTANVFFLLPACLLFILQCQMFGVCCLNSTDVAGGERSCKSAVDSATVCEWGSLCMHTERSTIEAAHFISMFLFHLQESTKAKNALGVNFQARVLNPIF